MGERVAFVDGDDVGAAMGQVHEGARRSATRVKGQDLLVSEVDCLYVEGLEEKKYDQFQSLE